MVSSPSAGLFHKLLKSVFIFQRVYTDVLTSISDFLATSWALQPVSQLLSAIYSCVACIPSFDRHRRCSDSRLATYKRTSLLPFQGTSSRWTPSLLVYVIPRSTFEVTPSGSRLNSSEIERQRRLNILRRQRHAFGKRVWTNLLYDTLANHREISGVQVANTLLQYPAFYTIRATCATELRHTLSIGPPRNRWDNLELCGYRYHREEEDLNRSQGRAVGMAREYAKKKEE